MHYFLLQKGPGEHWDLYNLSKEFIITNQYIAFSACSSFQLSPSSGDGLYHTLCSDIYLNKVIALNTVC